MQPGLHIDGMLRKSDLILVAITFGGIFLGTAAPFALPGVENHIGRLPEYCVMAQLFLSFLNIPLAALADSLKRSRRYLGYLALNKLIIVPALVYLILKLILPEYALGGLILAGASTGVLAFFFGDTLGADSPLLLLLISATSFLVPLTLPLLTLLLAQENLNLPIGEMIGSLAMILLLPLVLAQFVRHFTPAFLKLLQKIAYPLSLALIFATNFGVFSQYSAILTRNPELAGKCLAACFLLAGLLFVMGIALAKGKSIQVQVSGILGITLMNCTLMLVFSAKFLGAIEILMAALYSVPFFLMFIPIKWYKNLLLSKQR